MKTTLLLIIAGVIPATISAYEQAFAKTGVGTIELKTIPASKLIASRSAGHYFKHDNGLFMPLFRYINREDIAMTTPVEAEMMPGKMYFYIGGDAKNRELESTDRVTVHELPERKVASIGARGSYSEGNFNAAKIRLQKWLADHPTHEAAGEARGIFWNGPMMPGFLKRFEVHIPIAERKQDAD